MKNTGKPSEKTFDEVWRRLGKRAHVFEFTDSAKASGLNNRKTNTGAQPSDRIVTFEGQSWFAEVKSTTDPDCFRFSLLRTTQGAYAAGVIAAGGRYDVYIHSLVHDRWYCVPYAVIKAAPQKHFKWNDLEEFEWIFPT